MRVAVVSTILAVGCGVEVVDFEPPKPRDVQVVVIGNIEAAALAPFQNGEAKSAMAKELALRYPADELVVPRNVPPLGVRWDDAMMPMMMADRIYELLVSSEEHAVAYYTRDRFVNAISWSALQGTSSSQLTLRLRAIDGPKRNLLEAKTHTLQIADTSIDGELYFESERGIEHGRFDDSSAQTLATMSSCLEGYAISPDLSRLGIACSQFDGSVLSLADDALIRALPAETAVTALGSFDPNGTHFVRANDGQLEIVDVSNGTVSVLATPMRASAPDWSPSGDAITFIMTQTPKPMPMTSDSVLARVVHQSDGSWSEPVVLFAATPELGALGSPRYAPRGDMIAFGASDKMGRSVVAWMATNGGTPVPLPLDAPMAKGTVDPQPTWLGADWLALSLLRNEAGDVPGPQIWVYAVDAARLPMPTALQAGFWLPAQSLTMNNQRALLGR